VVASHLLDPALPRTLNTDRTEVTRMHLPSIASCWKLAIVLAAVPLVAGCQPTASAPAVASNGEAKAEAPQAVTRVTPITPARKRLVRTIELPGRADAYETTPLHSKVTGFVQKVAVDIGDSIVGPRDGQPGMALCELLVPELKEELIEKQALTEQTKSEIAQSDAGINVAESAVRAADAGIDEAKAAIAKEEALFAKFKSEFDRVSQLAESGVVTQKVADEAKAQLDAASAAKLEVTARIASAEAARQQALASLEKAKADATAKRSQMNVVEAERRRVETMLEYAVIRAPFDGVVVERNVHTGHLVQAGGSSNQKPVLTVMRIDPIRILVEVPEADAVPIAKGTKVELTPPAAPGTSVSGTIARAGWSLHETSRTLSAEIELPNPDGKWRPGQYVPVKITIADLPDAISLPKTAIVTLDKQTFCYCIEADNKVSKRPIELGILAGTDYEIRSGLTGDEKVIGANVSAFREGQVVEVVPAKP
jgi:RND family efflux transporter MFP subunit